MGRNRASKNKNRTDNVGTKASIEPMETVASGTTSSIMGDDETDKSNKQVADKMEKYTTEDTSSGENNSKDVTQFDKKMKDLTYYENKCSSLKANLRASEKKVEQRNAEIKKLEEEKADLEGKNLELSKRLTKLQEDWENLKREKSNTADTEQLAMDVDPNKDESLEQQMENHVPQFQSVQLQCRPTTSVKQPHKQPGEFKNTEHKSLSSGAKQGRRISDDTKSNISTGGKHPCVSHQSSIYYKQSGDSGKYQRGRGNRPDMKFEWNTNYKINHDRSSGRLMLEKPAEYKVVREVDGDLFEAPEDNSLAHCVAEDMCMGSGIAVAFKREFKSVDELLDQRKRQGDVAVLEQSQRYIYYLVTKRVSNGKPTMDTLQRSLIAMRDHVVTNKVTKIAMPRIGCGLDRLEWNRVKPLIEYVFSGLDVTITVYNLREDAAESKPTYSKSVKIKEAYHPVADIPRMTAILCLCAADDSVDPVLQSLDRKFSIINKYKCAKKKVGTAFEIHVPYYLICVLFVKEMGDDVISFTFLKQSLLEARKTIDKEQYEYVALEAFHDKHDEFVMEKVLTIVKNCLHRQEVWLCWPESVRRKL